MATIAQRDTIQKVYEPEEVTQRLRYYVMAMQEVFTSAPHTLLIPFSDTLAPFYQTEAF